MVPGALYSELASGRMDVGREEEREGSSRREKMKRGKAVDREEEGLETV